MLMDKISETYQIVIVGGGPVGLFLGLCLEELGISYLIIEKRSAPPPGSRSLGIHPVSLELFKKLGIAHLFVERGIKIQRGHAFSNKKKLGTLSFETCPKPYNYILALPQYQTERLLNVELKKRHPNRIIRQAEVTQISQMPDGTNVTFKHNGKTVLVHSHYVIGCDGKDSLVRKEADIAFDGHQYPDTYIMGDFEDNTNFQHDAAIFLCDEGLIESFPLPQNRRRWVVKTSEYLPEVTPKDISRRVEKRIGYSLDTAAHFMLSSFGVQKLLAKPMINDHIILCGDAAHIVSPIGGQGMNLGWLDAWDLSKTLKQAIDHPKQARAILNMYQQRRKHAARNAIHRAELNMLLGRKQTFPVIRNNLVSLILNTPISKIMADIFTMRGVERWVV